MAASEAAPPANRRRPRRQGEIEPEQLVEDIGVLRRAPFGENPAVGERGTRTQQRILLAALDLFGEVGYHGCRVEAITAAAGCSRPSFYQYFSSKEDLFRQLAGVVARQQFRVVERMGDITPDAEGWHNLRAWLDAQASIYETYQPVFSAFADAAGSDDLVATSAARLGGRMRRSLDRKVDPSALRSYPPEVLNALLSHGVNGAIRHRQVLLAIAPDLAPDRHRMLDGLAEVLHRALFGRRGGGMIEHRPAAPRRRVPRVSVSPILPPATLGAGGKATYGKLLDAAAATFATLGYHDARVDDIVTAAGTSHGTFYRYFENKEAVFRAVVARVGQRIFDVLIRIPGVSEAPASAASTRRLRSWITEYSATWRAEGPIVRLWQDAAGKDDRLDLVTARALDIVIRALMGFLSHRDFGDAEVDALLLVSILELDQPGVDPLPVDHDELLLKVIRRGFLGIETRNGAR